ncbi:MAG TPA: hypothetical protein VG816_01595 [Solirubrobacterales bacterium]|nr:hypothetical protein [Solirubrobacterales bacterium]
MNAASPERRQPAPEPSLPGKVIAIHDQLRAAKIPHAVGGALALAYYAEPRATIDIDVNVFVPASKWKRVFEALESLGIDTGDLDTAALERDGQCRLWWNDNAVDLFFANEEIHDEMRRQIRRVPFANETIPILAPEHLAICKAMFDRPKDWIDIEQMLVAAEDFDPTAVEDWLVRMVGDDDSRLRRLREMKAQLSVD